MNGGAPDVDAALAYAARHFHGEICGQRRYGWLNKSIGSAITLRDGAIRWLRVQHLDPGRVQLHRWNGEIDAAALRGIDKPQVCDRLDWYEGTLIWRALVMTKSSMAAVSETPTLHRNPNLGPLWFDRLRRSLKVLAGQKTARVFCGPGYFAAPIHRVFGTGIDTAVTRRMVCHGDLQWANVGWPEPILFDWETWGYAPFGFDAARLLVYSGCQPLVAQEVARAFADVLTTRDGLLSILYACAEATEMIRLHQYPSPELQPSIEALARDTLQRLAAR